MLLSMGWRDALFVHWPVPPERIRELLPAGLEPDLREGSAWVGAIPFRMEDLRLRGVPVGVSFPELNFRTYVTHDGDPGVYFLSLDAGAQLTVSFARRVVGLPYYRAEARLAGDREVFRFALRRTHEGAPPARFVARYRPTGPASRVEDDSLAAFLVERYRYYLDRDGQLLAGELDRDPLELQPVEATVESNSMFAAAGLDDPEREPRTWYTDCGRMEITADPPRTVVRG